jgi:hypothetical protein
MSPQSENSVGSSGGVVCVIGFVKAPGRYSYREGMTVEEALDLAGGYDTCESCQAIWEGSRSHATYDGPPKLKRGGRRLQLPKLRAEWSQFKLERDDEVKFRHVVY